VRKSLSQSKCIKQKVYNERQLSENGGGKYQEDLPRPPKAAIVQHKRDGFRYTKGDSENSIEEIIL